MAIWQFTFHLVPREAIKQRHRLGDRCADNENVNAPSYWPRHYAADAEALLPPRESWSSDAFMFGDEQGDCIELWDDGINVRLDVRHFNDPLTRALVNLASVHELNFVLPQGRSIPPLYDELIREIAQSRAIMCVLNPEETLGEIGQERGGRKSHELD